MKTQDRNYTLSQMLAGFAWNGSRYVLTVCEHIVGEVRTLEQVKAFCEMHNGRLNESL